MNAFKGSSGNGGGGRIVDADELRAAVRFEDLVDPVAGAFKESSAGLADNGLIVMFPARPAGVG